MADMLTLNSRKPSSTDMPSKPERSRGGRIVAVVPVQSIGPILRERREAMGVTLAEAEVATRIRQKYLAALESDEWDLLPGEVVGRGFLRNYSTYLGLEPMEMIERRRAVADESMAAVLLNTSAGTPLPPERKVDYRPKDVALKDESEELAEPRRLNLAPLSAVLAVVALAVFAWWGVTQFGSQAGDWIASAQKQVQGWQPQATPAPLPAAEALLPNNLVAPTATVVQPQATATVAGSVAVVPPPAADTTNAATAEAVATAEVVITPAEQPTPAPTSEPVSLLALLPTPTPQPAPVGSAANTAANLRGGPGLDYPIVAGTTEGQLLTITGRSADGAWYQLGDGSWIFGELVTNPPADVPVVEAPPLPAPAEQPAPVEQPAATQP